MKKNLFIAAMSLLVLAGCSNNEEIDNVVAKADNAITFDSYVGKITKASTAIDTEFGVFAYEGTWNAGTSKPNFMFNQKVEVNGTYSPIKYWPGTNVSFIAYAPYQESTSGIALNNYLNTTAGLPSMIFSLQPTANVDLLVSKLTAATSGTVSLVLKHTLAKVTFLVEATGDQSTTINIASIKLTGMNQTGTLSFGKDNCTWGTFSSTTDFNITQSTAYLLIPQPLTDLKASIKYTITTKDAALPDGEFTSAEKTSEIALETASITAWEISKQYNYTIKPTLDEITLNATVEEWEEPAEAPAIPK